MKRVTTLLLGMFVVVSSGRISAEETIEEKKISPELEQQFLDTADELRCPTCQGLSVLGSDAKFSVQIKNAVKEQLEQGKTKAEILAYFTDRYGPWILREPPKEGFNLVAWLLPIALMVLGPIGMWFFVWRKRKDIPTEGMRPSKAILDEFEERLSKLRGQEGAV